MVSIGIVLVQTISERIFIGVYCLIFGLYWRIQLKRTDRWKGVLLYPLTASFILCTAYFIISIIQVQFLITVSHLQVVNYCSDVMAPNLSGVQLIFEFPDSPAERHFIGTHLSLDDHRRKCTIYCHRLHLTINIGECASYTIISRLMFFSLLNEALPMLDHVAPTIGYGYPVYFITCIFRC